MSFRFKRIAGACQPEVKNADDLRRILELDPALWAVTGLPIDSVVFNPDFLRFVDSDVNGRIRPAELKEAIRHLFATLDDDEAVNHGSDILTLARLRHDSPDGAAIAATAELLLENLGKPGATTITLDEIYRRDRLTGNALGNGDGIVPPEHIEDELVAEYAKAVAAAFGTVNDATGAPGIDLPRLLSFDEAFRKYHDWQQAGEDAAIAAGAGLLEALAPLRARIDDFFLFSCLPSGAPVNGPATPLNALDSEVLLSFLQKAPLAEPAPGAALDLGGWINPLWRDQLAELFALLHQSGLTAAAGRLDEAEWAAIKIRIAPREAWLALKPSTLFDLIPPEKRTLFLAKDCFGAVRKLIDEDSAAKAEIAVYEKLLQLVLYQKFMLEFANNFVSLERLFEPDAISLARPGRLIMDGRHFTLATKVSDIAEHKRIIQRSDICVIYVDLVTGPVAGRRQMTLAVAVTSGDIRHIFVGQTGVFADAAKVEWDAKVIDLVQQPVSLGEAIRSPFYRFGEYTTKQANRFFSAKSDEVEKNLAGTLTSAKPQQTPAFSGAMLLMGGGVGIAAIGSAFAFIVSILKSTPVLHVLIILFAIILIICAPMLSVSLVKLWSRSITDFLAAGSWAVNPRMRLSNRMGLFFTHKPAIPPGSTIENKLLPVKPGTSKFMIALLILLLLTVLVLVAVQCGIF